MNKMHIYPRPIRLRLLLFDQRRLSRRAWNTYLCGQYLPRNGTAPIRASHAPSTAPCCCTWYCTGHREWGLEVKRPHTNILGLMMAEAVIQGNSSKIEKIVGTFWAGELFEDLNWFGLIWTDLDFVVFCIWMIVSNVVISSLNSIQHT